MTEITDVVEDNVTPQFNVTKLPDHVSKRFRYYDQGPVWGCFTIQATAKDGEREMYYSFAMYPTGPGSRSGKRPKGVNNTYELRAGSLCRHRSKKQAQQRAKRITLGQSLEETKRPKKKSEPMPPNTGMCMKERKVRPMYDMVASTMKNGRPSITGKCEFCDTKIVKIGKLVDCTSCGRLSEADPSDYICKECRS